MTRSIDILSEAIQILGPPVKIEEHRGWAIWWCPFHQDAARSGKSKRPNFGINFAPDGGYWKCLRCGAHGPSLKKLRQQIGVYQPPPVVTETIRAKSQIYQLDEALVEALYLFDVFAGDPIPAGKKSVSFRVVYRSAERTLEDETVNEIHHHLTHRLITEFGAALPA